MTAVWAGCIVNGARTVDVVSCYTSYIAWFFCLRVDRQTDVGLVRWWALQYGWTDPDAAWSRLVWAPRAMYSVMWTLAPRGEYDRLMHVQRWCNCHRPLVVRTLLAIRPDRTRGGRSSYEGALQHMTMFDRPLAASQTQRRSNGAASLRAPGTAADFVLVCPQSAAGFRCM